MFLLFGIPLIVSGVPKNNNFAIISYLSNCFMLKRTNYKCKHNLLPSILTTGKHDKNKAPAINIIYVGNTAVRGSSPRDGSVAHILRGNYAQLNKL